MKKFKIAAALLVIAFAVASAFTVPVKTTKQKVLTHYYFRYLGTDNSNTQIQDADNWLYLGDTEPSLGCEAVVGKICFIETDMDEATFFASLSSQTEASLSDKVKARRD